MEKKITAFSELKAAWHTNKINDLRQGKNIVPLHVQLILSDLCNQNCHFCAYRMDGGFSTENFADALGNKNPNRRIPTEKAIEILNDCAELGVKAIEFTGGGEPTVHPDCFKIIKHAQDLGMDTGLVTNAVKLEPCEAIENLTWLRISLDAGDKEEYERIRQSRKWDKVLSNIEYAATLTKPLVGVGYVITKENYKNVVKGCKIAKERGVPYVRISAMFSDEGSTYYADIIDEIRELCAEAKLLEDDKFKIVNFFENRIEDLDLGRPDHEFCGFKQFNTYIGGDLKVYACCTTAYTRIGEIGDLNNMTFKEYLETSDRLKFNARSCHHCQFNEKNKVINYLIDNEPQHINFI